MRGNDWRKTVLPTYGPAFGETQWREAWAIPVILAYMHLFEMHDLPKAAEDFREAGALPHAAGHIRTLAGRLDKPGGIYEVGIRLLGFMIPAAPEGPKREDLVRKRAMLTVHYDLWKINTAFDEWKASARGPKRGGSLERLWREFKAERRPLEVDLFGGRIDLNPATGKVETTTPLEKVLGMG